MELPEWLAAYRERPIRVGFSGGADSTALLLALHEAGFAVTAVHFEHGLRGEAGRADALRCRDFCAQRAIPYRQFSFGLTPGPNLEANARACRLRHWRQLCAEEPLAVVALGHHAGDAAETLLMRLARGANTSGLAGLRPVRHLDGVEIIRPLLEWRRAEIEQFLAARAITSWCHDTTNADWSYLRNYLRGKVLPEWEQAFPFVAGAWRESHRALLADAEYLEANAREVYSQRPPGSGLERQWLALLPEAMQIRVLRLWLAESSGADLIPDRELLHRMLTQSTGIVPVNAMWVLECVHGYWRLRPAEWPELAWHWRETPMVEYAALWRFETSYVAGFPGVASLHEAYFDLAELPDCLWLTGRRDGDTISVYGHRTPQPLKKFGPAGVVLRDAAGTIVWAPELRHARYAPVTQSTQAVLRLSCY